MPLEVLGSEGIQIRHDQRLLLRGCVIAWGGFVVHNVFEFTATTFFTPDTVGPTVLWIALGPWALLERGRTGERALLGWASLNAVGGTLTVLPLGLLPFHPAQTLSHYDVHLVYLAAQVPLIAVLIRSLTSEALA